MDKYRIRVDRWGAKYWVLNGKLHREGGPAVLYLGGGELYYLNGSSRLLEPQLWQADERKKGKE